MMTDRIRDVPRRPTPRGPLPGGRPRRRARQLPRLRARPAGHPHLLCRQGQSRRRRSCELLASLGSSFDTASVAEIEMVLDAGATPTRISFGNTIKKERDIARAHELGVTLFAVDCVAEVEKIARAAPRRPRLLPHPVRRRRRRMAAVAQVRLRAGHGRRRARARPPARPRRPRRLVPRRLAAARHGGLGPRARDGRRRVPRPAPSAASACRWSISAAASRRATCKDMPARAGLRPGDLRRAAPPFRQPPARDHHRAGPRHGRRCRRDPGRRSC